MEDPVIGAERRGTGEKLHDERAKKKDLARRKKSERYRSRGEWGRGSGKNRDGTKKGGFANFLRAENVRERPPWSMYSLIDKQTFVEA